MTFSKVSVLVPTRGRIANLERLITSYRRTVGPDMAELLFRIDEDDQATRDYLVHLPYRCVIGPRLDGYRSLPTFFEELRAMATGDVLLCGNDDMEFLTPDWPALILGTANCYPDGIFDLAVNTLNAGNVPFSIVSHAAVKAIGHLHDPRIYWGDVYLRDVMAAVDRVIPVPEVQIAHHWQGFAPDVTFCEARQNELGAWTADYAALHNAAVASAVQKLGPLTC